MNLAVVSAAGLFSGLLTAWVFRREGNPAATRVAVNRVLAYVMEFRLFMDEPRLILRAQWNLVKANWELLRSVARPSLLLLLPFVVITILLHACFGIGPLPVGKPAVLTLPYHDGETVEVQPPRGIALETGGVRAISAQEISYRLRPLVTVSGYLQIKQDGRVSRKRIVAGRGWPLQLSGEAATINYPGARVLGCPWWVWYGVGLLAGAILIRAVPWLPLQSF